MDPKKRIILHADANSFYASCEMCYRPELRGKAVVVGGDPEARHGIVLAKTDPAKKAGIRTGMVLWQAKQLCPGLICLLPNYRLYLRFSKQARDIFNDYSDKVEPFGLDEAWLDVSEPGKDLDYGVKIADEIRRRMRQELGITASVGVGDNKIMAKLGSDYKKPDATTRIGPQDYADKVWPTPVEDLLYVGSATRKKLNKIGVLTIGQLANLQPEVMTGMLGKVGLMLWQFANGLDASPVCTAGYESAIKSIGNSTTTPRDLTSTEDVRLTVYLLAESVAERLREHGLRARVVEISVRDKELYSFVRQRKIKQSTCISSEIAEAAMELFRANYSLETQLPIRSIGVRGADLETADTAVQLTLFEDNMQRVRLEALERAVGDIRRRFGHFSLQRGMMLADQRLSNLSPKDDHVIHPVAYLR